ncbi:putative phage abortive infection protein [Cedecea sp. P7760]|nr:putative phage abortive infection protein [Cedecea sp. P7760]
MNREQKLSHYYRFVYNLLKFIDGSNLSDVHKKKYVNILRAQLSDYELLMLFYNGQSPKGKKFIFYFEKYSLLDNLPVNKLIFKIHVVFCEKSAWGDNDEALRYFPQTD